MLEQQRKWWRWLGEPSESGGMIGRYEGGQLMGSGIWRPSKHSLMKTLGYAFDQPARERMTQRISARASLVPASTPSTAPVGADRVLWVETAHPVSHELTVTWTVDGGVLPDTGNRRHLDLAALGLAPGTHTVTAAVVDPTEFVRDPAVRGSTALTQTRTWLVDTALTTTPATAPPTFTSSTGTNRPLGADDVVYAETGHPTSHALAIAWTLDGEPASNPGNDRDLDLAAFRLKRGTHAVTATVTDPAAPAAGSQTLAWTVDAEDPDTRFALSKALFKPAKPTHPRNFVFNGPFTMELTATDDQPGYLVREFRTDGDGWFNYFGWPTDSEAPFLFTPSGTNIDDLVYGKLGVPRLSPWDDPTPSYGRHTIEYRAIDSAGNVAAPSEFVVVLIPTPPACTTTLTGRVTGGLVVPGGVTCLDGARVVGPVTVQPGASLVATDAKIDGTLTSSGAGSVQLLNSAVTGAVSIAGSTSDVLLVGTRLVDSVDLDANAGPRPAVLAGNTLLGPLDCAGNTPAPVNHGIPNTLHAPASGQCAGL